MTIVKGVKKPITHKGKKFLQNRQPKLVESKKHVIFIRGRKTNENLMRCVKDIYALKKPDATLLNKKNDILPFENATSIEKLVEKNNSPLFLFASSTKKRPNGVIFGRCFNNQILDMLELGIENYTSSKEYNVDKISPGLKPCLIFNGESFTSNEDLARLKNLFIDFFQRETVDVIRLQGLEHVLVFTAVDKTVYMKSYRVLMKKSGVTRPRIELEEIGPSVDFTIRRTKLATEDLLKSACKKPKELKVKKKKNITKNVFGTVEGRIHVQKQNISTLKTKKMKGLSRSGARKKKQKQGNEGSVRK